MPRPALDAVVVGAGIAGLAAAYELARRDQRVLVIERAGVGAEQSAGLGRIFRVAHADTQLCALALESHAAWQRWERDLGAGRLLGDEGLVVAGDGAAEDAAAMRAAGARVEPLDRRAVAERVPLLATDHPWDGAILDPLGGSLRIRRALQALAARVDVRRGEVEAIADGADAAAVRLTDGTDVNAAAVLVCAGTATGPLAASAGVPLEQEVFHHVRLTYAPRAGHARERPPACLIVPGAYGLPLGSTGRWALGLDDPGEPQPVASVDPDTVAAAVRAQHAAWVGEWMPGLDPHPVDEIRCVWLAADWLVAGEDGFAAVRRGRVVALGASNAMKFGPLLGDRLARTVLDPDGGVHPDLQPRRAAV
jgi:glycine/D-amino acid oxidase-like deaminating enzyme